MKVKKIGKFLNFILPKSVIGITLFPFGIYLRDNLRNYKKTVNHESIHWEQQIDFSIVGLLIGIILSFFTIVFNLNPLLYLVTFIAPFTLFYLLYLLEWIVKLPKYGKRTYRSLSFEREAYGKEYDYEYLKERKALESLKYLFKSE